MTVPSDPRQIYPVTGSVPGLRYLGDLDDVIISTPADGQALVFDTDHWENTDQLFVIPFVVGDGTNEITAGIAGGVECPVAGTIVAIRVISLDGTSGDIVFDLWLSDYTGAPPTVTETIIDTGGGGVKPTLSGATKAEDTTLAHYATAVAAGDIIVANVDSAATVKLVGLYITVTKG
jgi:hypothetical protein